MKMCSMYVDKKRWRNITLLTSAKGHISGLFNPQPACPLGSLGFEVMFTALKSTRLTCTCSLLQIQRYKDILLVLFSFLIQAFFIFCIYAESQSCLQLQYPNLQNQILGLEQLKLHKEKEIYKNCCHYAAESITLLLTQNPWVKDASLPWQELKLDNYHDHFSFLSCLVFFGRWHQRPFLFFRTGKKLSQIFAKQAAFRNKKGKLLDILL